MRALPLCLTMAAALAPTLALAAESPSLGSAALQTLWALAVVVGLILALYGLSKKRWLPGRTAHSAIKVIELRPVMPKATLALVEVRGRELLVGISAGGMQLLADLSRQPEKASDFHTVLSSQQ
jgi:flagellar protein FliO/FliZ